MLSVVAFGIGFGWLGVHTANKWEIAAGMYIVGRKCNFVRQTAFSVIQSLRYNRLPWLLPSEGKMNREGLFRCTVLVAVSVC